MLCYIIIKYNIYLQTLKEKKNQPKSYIATKKKYENQSTDDNNWNQRRKRQREKKETYIQREEKNIPDQKQCRER